MVNHLRLGRADGIGTARNLENSRPADAEGVHFLRIRRNAGSLPRHDFPGHQGTTVSKRVRDAVAAEIGYWPWKSELARAKNYTKNGSAPVRANRRYREIAAQRGDIDEAAILADIRRRDARDSKRDVAPLDIADNAHLLDTTELDIEAAFRAAVDLVDRVCST